MIVVLHAPLELTTVMIRQQATLNGLRFCVTLGRPVRETARDALRAPIGGRASICKRFLSGPPGVNAQPQSRRSVMDP